VQSDRCLEKISICHLLRLRSLLSYGEGLLEDLAKLTFLVCTDPDLDGLELAGIESFQGGFGYRSI
jgi:hypothetical protein